MCAIAPGRFEFCPICYVRPADSREHVPPPAFGGQVMTYTCARCNNTFGSRTESSLQDWYDNAGRVRLTRADHPRPIAQFRTNLLTTETNEFVLMTERGSDPGVEFDQVVGKEELSMEIVPPVFAEVLNGILKSVYLAAALHMGGVPATPSATEIRGELQAVLTASNRADVIAGPRASALSFYRTGTPPTGPPLAVLRDDDRDADFISLAGTVLVGWPFPEIDPITRIARLPSGQP